MGYTKVETLRQIYPSGTRLKLIHMEDSQSVPDGMTGTVDYVDDAGNYVHSDEHIAAREKAASEKAAANNKEDNSEEKGE